MEKDNNAVWKMVILALCSFFGITNIISLFIVAKKLHSKILNIVATLSTVGIVGSFVVLSSSNASSSACALAVVCLGVCCVLPSVLVWINLSKYKVASDLEYTLKDWNVNLNNIEATEAESVCEISWVSPKQLKVAKQVYGKNGLLILDEINKKMKDKEEQEVAQREKEHLLKLQKEKEEKERLEIEKAEKEKKEREQREFELAKIQAEKDKAEAEAKTLQLKKENDNKLKEEKRDQERQKCEEREFELAKPQPEKENAENEALQLKKEAEEAEIKKMKMEKEKTCVSCGKELLIGADFCVYCGAKIAKSE